MEENVNARIRNAAENFRQELVSIFGIEPSRPLALALTKIDEAELWTCHLAQQAA